jgi:hypothetical protein
MTVDDFRQTLTATKPPAELTFALLGLWWDAKSEWTRAHESAQQDEGPEGSWVRPDWNLRLSEPTTARHPRRHCG